MFGLALCPIPHVSFAARNYETNIHSFVLQMKHFNWSNHHSCLGKPLLCEKEICTKKHSRLNANGSKLKGCTIIYKHQLTVLN